MNILWQNIISSCFVLYELLTKYLVAKRPIHRNMNIVYQLFIKQLETSVEAYVWMIMCDTIFSNSYSYILICFCSNLIVRIWFFLNGNLFLCYRFMLFLEFNSQIDCYSLLDKNFLLTTVATRNCLSCKNKHSIYILSLHVV